MKNYLICFLLLKFLSFAHLGLYAQDTDTSEVRKSDETHALFNDNLSNPAYTGVFGGQHLHVFGGVSNPFYNYGKFNVPVSASASYDFSFGKKVNQSLGVFYNRSQEGYFSGYNAGLSYARMFDLYVTKDVYHKLRIGASLYYQEEQFDRSRLTFGDQIDLKYGFVWNTSEYYYKSASDTLKQTTGLNAGLWYHNPIAYFGIATNSMFDNDTTQWRFNAIPRMVNIAVGGHVYLNGVYALHPALNIEWGLGSLKMLSSWSPSLTVSRNNKLYLGFQYKDMNKLTVVAGVNAGKAISFSLMYGVYPSFGFGLYDAAFLGTQLRLKIR